MPILTAEERLGQCIAERYHLDAVLSSGGMGVLFRASDRTTGEQVAIKILKPAHTLNPDHVARFTRETRIAGAIRHPNIARVLDVWSDDEGVTFLVMELLRGRSLAQELEQRKTLPFAEVLALAIPIASALEAAHAMGTVHRDIKPSNIFLCDYDDANASAGGFVPKLLDFGIAKSTDDEFETDTGLLVGTPGYMAPERIQYGECSAYTDIWGLGAVIYSCLAGHPPHAGGSVHEMLGKLVREPVPGLEVAGVGKRSCAIIERALARDPQLRYHSIGAFRQALSALASGEVSAPDETATFDAAEFAQPASASAAVVPSEPSTTGVARDLPVAATRASRLTLRSRPLQALVLACLASGALLALGFAPTGAKPPAADRQNSPPVGSPAASGLVAERPVEQASLPTASLPTRDAAAERLLVESDAVVSDAAARALHPPVIGRAPSARVHRTRVSSRKRDASQSGTDVQLGPAATPDPMDRRR